MNEKINKKWTWRLKRSRIYARRRSLYSSPSVSLIGAERQFWRNRVVSTLKWGIAVLFSNTYLPIGTGSCHQWNLAISQLWNKFEKPDLTTPSKIRAEKLVIPVKLRRANCSQSTVTDLELGSWGWYQAWVRATSNCRTQITECKFYEVLGDKTSSQVRPAFRASCHHLRTIAKEHSFCNLRAHRVYCSSYRQSIPAAPRERIISPRKVTN